MLIANQTVQSILDSISSISKWMEADESMQAMLDVTDQQLQVEMLGFFLFSASSETAFLQAGTGKFGKDLIAKGHKILLHLSPKLLMPVANGEIRINDGWSGKVYGCLVPAVVELGTKLPLRLLEKVKVIHSENAPLTMSVQLPAPRWEIALPLRVKENVFGALYIQVLEFSRFTLEDCPNLQWLADQISAIYAKKKLA